MHSDKNDVYEVAHNEDILYRLHWLKKEEKKYFFIKYDINILAIFKINSGLFI